MINYFILITKQPFCVHSDKVTWAERVNRMLMPLSVLAVYRRCKASFCHNTGSLHFKISIFSGLNVVSCLK